MDQPPHEPYDRKDRAPSAEQLSPGEIDLTGTIWQPNALRDVIYDALAEADGDASKVPVWGARVIARELANGHPAGPGALHQYAVTGTINHAGLARELAPYSRANDDELRELAEILGQYFIGQPAGRQDSPDTRPAAPGEIEEGLKEHGGAFWAYLQVEDAAIEGKAALEQFRLRHLGSYASVVELVNDLTEFHKFKDALESVTAEWGFEDFIQVDTQKLEATARSTWHVIKFGGKLHVFTR